MPFMRTPTLDPILWASTAPAGPIGKCTGSNALRADPTTALAPSGSPTDPSSSYTKSHLVDSTRLAGAIGKCNGCVPFMRIPPPLLLPLDPRRIPMAPTLDPIPCGSTRPDRLENAMGPLLDPNTLVWLLLFMCCFLKIKKGPPWHAGRQASAHCMDPTASAHGALFSTMDPITSQQRS